MGVITMKSFEKFRSLVTLVPALLVLAACGGGGGGGGSSTPVTTVVSGSASKGPVAAGTVSVYRLNEDGSRETEPLTTAVTAADGSYQVTVDPQQAAYVVLVLADGSYTDEATGSPITLAAGEQMEVYTALPASGQITVNITPLTTLAAAQAREHMANDGQTLSDAITNAAAEVSSIFVVGDVMTTNLPPLTDLGSASQQEINYVLLLAGLSQLDKDDSARTAFEVLDDILADLEADGVWGDSATTTPPNLRTATNQFLTDNGTITESLSAKLLATLAQAELDFEAAAINIPPVANDDSATVDEGNTVNIDLAANDFDAEGALDLASISIVSAPSNGSVTVNANGTVDYTHDGGETVNDVFTYTIADSDTASETSNTATVAVTVTPVNDDPVASDDAATLSEGATTLIDLAANDSDAEGALDLASISIVSAPANGAVVVNTDGTVDYTHDGSETVSDSFSYTIKDTTTAESNAATVSITVTAANDAPVANDDTLTMNEALTVNIDLAANDTDADDGLDLTSIAIVSGPSNGTINSVNADGTVTYTHNGSATTADSFTYTIKDTTATTSNTATVNLTVLQAFNEALFATPTASSATSPAREFQANDGLTLDASNGWVASAGPATLTLTFDSPKSIYRVTLSDLVDLTHQVTSATIDFSNGDQIPVSTPLPNDGTAQEFVFAPKLVTSITVTLNTANGVFGLSEFSAYTALDPGQTLATTELFNDGDAAIAARWPTPDDECGKGTAVWSGSDGSVAVNNEYVQSGDCRGFTSQEGVELGTYPVLSGFTVKDMDLRLRFKSTDTSGAGATWVNGAIGVLFAYRTNDYYRLDLSQAEGHTKLWKKVGDGLGGGDFTELTTSPQSYAADTWVNLRIVRQNGVIVVYLDNVKVMAVEDNEVSLNNNAYQIALLCARNESCSFENLIVLTPPDDPIVGVNVDDDGGLAGHLSGEYYVDTSGTLELIAAVTDTTGIDGVEFEVDGDAGTAQTDATAPYTATFGSLTTGNHTVRAYLRDSSGRLTDADAVDELPAVGVSGIHLVGLGDSITGGLFDDIAADDTSSDGRNTSGGYQPVLNNLLTTANSKPVTVLNEGNAGELSSEGADRIDAVLARTPAAQGYLAIYGANDSSGGLPTPSGTTLTCTDLVNFTGCDAGYLGSFKHNMQRIINAVTGAGKAIYLAEAPPHLTNVTRDTQIQEYNTVIGELITVNGFTYTPADFHTYFTANPGEMADDLHPDGTGYQSMANIWCTSLNGQAGMICP